MVCCRKYRCKKCNQRFLEQADLEEHTATDSHHYQCTLCEEEAFVSDAHLKRHLSLSHGATFKCDYCEKAFKTATYLKVHSVIHSGEKPFVCEICEAAFNRRDKLKRHALVHNPVKAYKCGECQREFSRPDKLKAHMVTHSGARPYHVSREGVVVVILCHICSNEFLLLLQCVHCSRSFTRPAHLKKHVKNHEMEAERNELAAAAAAAASSANSGGSGHSDESSSQQSLLLQHFLQAQLQQQAETESSGDGDGGGGGQQHQQQLPNHRVFFDDGTAAIFIAESCRAKKKEQMEKENNNSKGSCHPRFSKNSSSGSFLPSHHRRGSFLENEEGKENEHEVVVVVKVGGDHQQQQHQQQQQQQQQQMIKQSTTTVEAHKKPEGSALVQQQQQSKQLMKRQFPTEAETVTTVTVDVKKGPEKRIKKRAAVGPAMKKDDEAVKTTTVVVVDDDEDDSQDIYLAPNYLKDKMEVIMLEDEEEAAAAVKKKDKQKDDGDEEGDKGGRDDTNEVLPALESSVALKKSPLSRPKGPKTLSDGRCKKKKTAKAKSLLTASVSETKSAARTLVFKRVPSMTKSIKKETSPLSSPPHRASSAPMPPVIATSDRHVLSLSSRTHSSCGQLGGPPSASNVSGAAATSSSGIKSVKANTITRTTVSAPPTAASPEQRTERTSQSIPVVSFSISLPQQQQQQSVVSPLPPLDTLLNLNTTTTTTSENLVRLYTCPHCRMSFFKEVEAFVHERNCSVGSTAADDNGSSATIAELSKPASLAPLFANVAFFSRNSSPSVSCTPPPPPHTSFSPSPIKPTLMLVDASISAQREGTVATSNGL